MIRHNPSAYHEEWDIFCIQIVITEVWGQTKHFQSNRNRENDIMMQTMYGMSLKSIDIIRQVQKYPQCSAFTLLPSALKRFPNIKVLSDATQSSCLCQFLWDTGTFYLGHYFLRQNIGAIRAKTLQNLDKLPIQDRSGIARAVNLPQNVGIVLVQKESFPDRLTCPRQNLDISGCPSQ